VPSHPWNVHHRPVGFETRGQWTASPHAVPPPLRSSNVVPDRGDRTRAQKIRTVELEGKTIKLQIVRVPAFRRSYCPTEKMLDGWEDLASPRGWRGG
jgi:hypothetical protein